MISYSKKLVEKMLTSFEKLQLLIQLLFYYYIHLQNFLYCTHSIYPIVHKSNQDINHNHSDVTSIQHDSSNLFRLIEESPNGTEIIGVSKYLHQYILYNLQFLFNENINYNQLHDLNKFQFNFQLLDIHDPLTNALDLESITGKLIIRKRIDRESICNNNNNNNNILPVGSSSSSSSRFPINGRPPIFLQNTFDTTSTTTTKYLTNLGYFSNPMHILSNNLNKRCIKTLYILSTTQLLEQNQVDIKKIPIDLLIIDINDNSPTWISINNGINYPNNNNNNSYMINLPTIVIQLSEVSNDQVKMIPTSGIYPDIQQYQQKEQSLLRSSNLPRAYDPDEGVNSQLTYHLQSINKKSINFIDNNNNNNANDQFIPFILEDKPNGDLKLISTVNLDYEEKQFYEFYLLATDSGLPQRTGTALIKVHIIDVNDHSPIFNQSIIYPFHGAISEKTIPGTIILNLSATDKDASSVNNQIRYFMIPGTLAMNYFNVQIDGTIVLKRWLDYETMEINSMENQLMLNSLVSDTSTTAPFNLINNNNNDNNINQNSKKQFIFQVKAIDSAPQPYERTSTATVIIPVIDENDEIPMITVKFLASSEMTNHGETGLVKENVQPPIQLAYVQVRDPDFNGNDEVMCTLTDTINFSLKSIHSAEQYNHNNPIHEINNRLQLQSSLTSSISLQLKNDYILNLITKPDREQNPLYYLRIKCTDQGLNFNEQIIRIRVLDMNDEQPKFQKSIYRFNLPENSDKEVKIINNEGYYQQNNKMRNIYEMKNESSSNKSIKQAKEYNDHYEYLIGRVMAEDNDQGENARIEYYLDEYFLEIKPSDSSILSSAYLLTTNKQTVLNDENIFIYHNREMIKVDQLFRIDSQTGILYALKKFDVENVDLFRFNVYALDQPNQFTSIRHTGTATIEIKITDVNDWPPLFIQTNYSIDNITDTTDNTVSSLISSNNIGNVHKNVNITSILENELNFVTNYIFYVKENRPAYWLIGRIIAIDLDVESKTMTHNLLKKLSSSSSTSSKSSFTSSSSSSSSYITLKIANDSPIEIRRTFNLHATQGYLRTSISLDREKQNNYVFNVIAYDGNPSILTSKTSTATVTVVVEDENDNDPVFIRPTTTISSPSTGTFSSSSSSSSAVLPQTNLHFLQNNQFINDIQQPMINYEKEINMIGKQQNNHDNNIKINWPTSYNPEDGNKKKRLKEINPDNSEMMKLSNAQINHNNKMNIPVVLVHRREKNIDFTKTEGEASGIGESRPLLQIEATDADIDENGRIIYEISAGNTDNLFVINSDTGILSLSPNVYSSPTHQFIESSSANAT
ncbi:unnamed protein product [Heterobilharzia americana]|nr:unnamed protein product [Heterobilharzia americana]